MLTRRAARRARLPTAACLEQKPSTDSIRPFVSGTPIQNQPYSPKESLTTTPKVEKSFEPQIFSGIQPTGIPHIGNYFGAIRQWVDLQNQPPPEATATSSKPFFSVVDLHALTIRQDPKQLSLWRKETLAALIAAGLDPLGGKCNLFFQSDVGPFFFLVFYFWPLSPSFVSLVVL